MSGLGLALAINTGIPGARYCMTAMFLTNLMPIIAVCLVWRLLLHPYGVVNQILQPFGFGRIDWLTNSATAMPAIIMVTVWRFAPYFMVVFLAALLALPDDYYEAAELDGAGAIRRFYPHHAAASDADHLLCRGRLGAVVRAHLPDALF